MDKNYFNNPHDIADYKPNATKYYIRDWCHSCQQYRDTYADMPLYIQFGSAVDLHKECVSKKLIKILHTHGCCMSYDDHRKLKTRVAIAESEKVMKGT
jgi:thiol-disulfide isomerase/thioredoxin